MSKWIVDIHGDIEGDYEIIKKYEEQQPCDDAVSRQDVLDLDKIYADIQKLRGCSCSCSDGIIDDVEDIIDKYKAESEE